MQTMALPVVSVTSAVPGRMRLKLPPLDFSGRENVLKEAVHSISGVTDMRWTKITHSLVIHYDHRQMSSEEILDRCQRVVTPLAAPITVVSSTPVNSSSVVGTQPGERSAGGGPTIGGHGEEPTPTTPSESTSSRKWLLGIFLVFIGAVLFVIPGVPGLPILLMGLTLLQLT